MLAVDDAMKLVSESPMTYPVVFEDVHRCLVKVFPFGIYYRIHGERIHVVAIIHLHRDPEVWRQR